MFILQLLLQCAFLGSSLATNENQSESGSIIDYFDQFSQDILSSLIPFEPYSMEPPAPFEGPLAPNTILDRAELVPDGEFIGPESIEYRGNEIYSGVVGGFIIRFNERDGTWEKIVQTGKPCAGLWDTNICGRPGGLRFDKTGKLIVADFAKGILSVDVDKKTVESLLPRYASIGNGYELPVNFANDLDIGMDGVIYFSDAGQYSRYVLDSLGDIIGNPTGRLIKFDPRTGQSEVLMRNLRFSNGVQLSRSQDFVLVSESAMSRVWKYHLRGAKKGQQEIFVDNLPGAPDNIRPNGKGGFFIALFTSRDEKHDLMRTLAPLWWHRQFMYTLQEFTISLFQQLYKVFPNDIVGQWLTSALVGGGGGGLLRKTIIVEVDETGKILGSLQNRISAISGISQFERRIGYEYSYFGTPSSSQFWRIKSEYLD